MYTGYPFSRISDYYYEAGNLPYDRFLQYTPIDLDGIPNNERVEIYSSEDNKKSTAEIQRLDQPTNKWIVEYSKTVDSFAGSPLFVFSGKWDVINRNAVVLWHVYGSGGCLNYTVAGRTNGRINVLAQRKEIYLGNVWFEGNRLFESEGNRFRLWVNKDETPQAQPYDVPIIPGALVIRYSISDNGDVSLENTSYQVKAGTVVQIIRTDLYPIKERVLYNDQPYLKNIEHRNAWEITDKGSLEFDIIPGGYNWDQAVHVSVKAE